MATVESVDSPPFTQVPTNTPDFASISSVLTSAVSAASSSSAALPTLSTGPSESLSAATTTTADLRSSPTLSTHISSSLSSPSDEFSTSSEPTSQATAATSNERHNSSPSGTIIGAVLGVILAVLSISLLIFWFVRRKRRARRRKSSALAGVAGDNDYHGKAELAGSDVDPKMASRFARARVAFVKPELEDTSVNVAQGSAPRLAAYLRNGSSSSTNVNSAPLVSPTNEKQVLESERHPKPFPEAAPGPSRPSQHHAATANDSQHSPGPLNELESPKYLVDGPRFVQNAGRLTEQPDSLSRLRAEHEALMARIRLAEERELKRNRDQR